MKHKMLMVAALVALTGVIAIPAAQGMARATSTRAASSTLTVALPGDITDFDPHTDQLIQYEYAIRNNVFDSLVRYNQTLSKIEPDLASSFSVNPAATKFTFAIRTAKFQDGTPVTADSVVQSLKRASGKKSIWAPRLSVVKKLQAAGNKVTITLTRPYAAFLDGLTDISILAPSSFATSRSHPIGSGPYKFVSWTANSQIVLQTWDGYWGSKPAVSEIDFKPIADPQVALTDLQGGQVDIVSEAPTSLVKQAKATHVGTIVEPPFSNSETLIEFRSDAKLKDVRVRRALAYALDKDAVRKIAYSGEGDSYWSPLPLGSWAYAKQTGYPYNLAAAKKLLQQAGVKNLTVTLDLLTGYPEAEQTARVWQSSLSKIGVKLNIRVSELSVWLDHYVKRNYDMIWNFFNVSGDPNSFFDVIMNPHLSDDFKSPQMQKLMAQAVATSNQAKRKGFYKSLQALTVSQLPVMVVQSRPITSIVASRVKGYRLNPLGWGLYDQVTLG